MIKQRIILSNWNWVIYAYYSVGSYYVDEIMNKLISIGCQERQLRKAYRNLSSGKLDTGLTYSNKYKRKSVIVIGNASTGAEFFNSLLHEMRHLEEHIADADNIEPYGEAVAYLIGDLSKEMYSCINTLLCDCCRKHPIKTI